MTADQIGIVVLVVLFAAGYGFRRWYKNQARSYKISENLFNGYTLTIYDHNPRADGATLEIKCEAPLHGDLQGCDFGIELIKKKRERFKMLFKDYDDMRFVVKITDDKKLAQGLLEKKSLLHVIRNEGLQLNRFRFYVQTKNGSLMKSPEFAFSTRFLIYRPDTGKYN
ncbi:MAG: hypothetical protein PF694_09880 [Bacteroidetes bacterium]|nr:hypothetical protein [Bacteroidota bacterium]